MFLAFDRLINTMACVIALTFWKVHPDKCEKGHKFVDENLNKLVDEKEGHMTPGFEILFPMLIELSQKLEIKLPNDSLVLQEIYARRDIRLAKIPKESFHKTPTILLYSLEGMKDLDWKKLLKLQSENGSFSFSPAATAFAFMQTKDQNCLAYLTNIIDKFNGGGIGMIKELGLLEVAINRILMTLLWLFWYYEPMVIKFLLAVTVMFNLYRASQVLFPGEKVLDNAKRFSDKFLTEKRSTNELLDRWIITKDLPGEVGYALDVPWYASLPRLEARCYLEQYGGEDDVWIAKTLYRMKNVSNNTYLEMAKLDYNNCQVIHQSEWTHIQKWYAHLNIDKSLNTRLLWSYYEAAPSIFEPEKVNERVAWAKTTVLLDIITSLFTRTEFSEYDMRSFVDEFTTPQQHQNYAKVCQVVTDALQETLTQISSDALAAHGVDIRPHIYVAWTTWLLNWQKGADAVKGEEELIVGTVTMIRGRWLRLEEVLSHPQYLRMSSVTNDLCHLLSYKDHTLSKEIELKMQKLVQLVLCDSPGDLDPGFKQTFLTVAKTFYYRSYFDTETVNHHIRKV